MAKRKGQRPVGLRRLLAGVLQTLVEIFAVLKESFFDWLERRKSGAASAVNAGARPEDRRRQGPKAGAAAPAKPGAATKATAAAPGSTRSRAVPEPPPHASASDSEEEEQQQQASAPLLPASWAALAAAPAQEAGWEPVRGKKQQRGAAGGTQSAGPARRGGGGTAAAQAQQRTRGELRACERPGCGEEGRGFRKCGRCGRVAYCTPGCLASDWERHQLQCDL